MNSFLKGVLVGAGLGLLFAPLRGDETRARLNESLIEFRQKFNEFRQSEQFQGYQQKVSEQLNRTSEMMKGYREQAKETLQQWQKQREEAEHLAAAEAPRQGPPHDFL